MFIYLLSKPSFILCHLTATSKVQSVERMIWNVLSFHPKFRFFSPISRFSPIFSPILLIFRAYLVEISFFPSRICPPRRLFRFFPLFVGDSLSDSLVSPTSLAFLRVFSRDFPRFLQISRRKTKMISIFRGYLVAILSEILSKWHCLLRMTYCSGFWSDVQFLAPQDFRLGCPAGEGHKAKTLGPTSAISKSLALFRGFRKGGSYVTCSSKFLFEVL
jgi:hypothetical protein